MAMNTQTLLRAILHLSLAIALYPAAIILVIATDTLAGDSEFLRLFLYESKRDALNIILHDWLHALPLTLALWLVVRGLAFYTNALIANSLIFIIAIGLLVFAFMPPYLPLVFGCLLLVAAACSSIFHPWLKKRTVA